MIVRGVKLFGGHLQTPRGHGATLQNDLWEPLIFRVFSAECSSLVPSVSIRYLFTKYDTGFASEFKWKETFVHRKTDLA